jgi:selenocysteine-specific elongation factor
MRVVGTAGHVDHGKSTLIKRLTGINPDRLKEEQDRQMSIELGFAWFDLPDGEPVGVVDVPGHRDFIENMLAGIGGIDATLFVVAADEGVMPQTREHLAILDLLEIPAGVVALTKIDLIDEPEWIELVKADLHDTLKGTVLADAPIMPVSGKTGEGLPALKAALAEILKSQPHRADLGRPRLPIDRVFTLSGFGTILTGTLLDGTFEVGDAVEVLPEGIEGRIRGLQSHQQSEQAAVPGSRTAVNVSGISVDQIRRGDVLVKPGTFETTTMLDIWFKLLPDASAPLRHNSEVKFFLGAAEVMARVRLLGCEELAPGDSAFLQLILKAPVVALRRDRYIIRQPSPPATIGGGQVVDPHPKHRHKRFNTARLAMLKNFLKGTPEEILMQTLRKSGPMTPDALINASGLAPESAKTHIKALEKSASLINLNNDKLLIDRAAYQAIFDQLLYAIETYHQRFPLQRGIPREQLKTQEKIETPLFNAVIQEMADKDLVVEAGAILHLKDHQIEFTTAQTEKVKALLKDFKDSPFAPPSYKISVEAIGEPLVRALLETKQLIQISEDVLLKPDVLAEMQEFVMAFIQNYDGITLAQLRDRFKTSRKYAVAVLEYMDQAGITRREGDIRTLRKHS